MQCNVARKEIPKFKEVTCKKAASFCSFSYTELKTVVQVGQNCDSEL